MSAFIDFQGFQERKGLFVVKELVIQPLNSRNSPIIMIFKPPCERSSLTEQYQATVLKCEQNYHGIAWEEGGDKYDEVSTVINEALVGKFDYIFVKGEERKNWLTFILRFNPMTIFNLDDLGCPDIKTLEEQHPAIRQNNSHSLCSSNMRKSIIHFCAVENIMELTKKVIAALPAIAIIKFATHQIDELWEKLSDQQRSNPAILKFKRCKIHPIQNQCDGDEVGLFYYVLVKDCLKCKELNTNDFLK